MLQFIQLTDPTPEVIQRVARLYRLAGWWPDAEREPETVARIIAGSHCFVAARDAAGCIIGMGRAISDGVSDAYIQDVTVAPDHRGKGVGSDIVAAIVRRLKADGLVWIGLVAENNSHPFYERLGFSRMPDATPLLMTIP